VDQLVSRQHDQDQQAILDWLTPTGYSAQQSDFLSRRQEGTGQWLLDSAEFKDWCTGDGDTLFCWGMPGAGKTIMISIVIDYLYNKRRNDSSVNIAYIYCNFRRQDEQKPVDLLASLLKQLLSELPDIPVSVRRLYEHHKVEKRRPSFDEISKELHSVVAARSKCFIIVDALDECHASDGGRSEFLAKLLELQKVGANLFATSRSIPEIKKVFERKGVLMEIQASEEDVRRYLDGHITRLPSFVLRSPDLQEEIKTEIVKAVRGMYVFHPLTIVETN
jgi:Cdc6-like AAA superfamily ATPase